MKKAKSGVRRLQQNRAAVKRPTNGSRPQRTARAIRKARTGKRGY